MPMGALLIMLANQTMVPLLYVVFSFSLGAMLCRIFGKHEQRSFGSTFALCVFVTGLSQSYAQALFGQIQTTSDAIYLYRFSTEPGIQQYAISELRSYTDGSLSVLLWNILYLVNSQIGFENKPYIGTLLNSFLVGLSAALTTRTARFIFGSDTRKLKLLEILLATCGMFWLFGAIHIRDSFVLFLTTLLMYGFIRILSCFVLRNVFVFMFILASVSVSMYYIRDEIIPIIAVLCVIGFMIWAICIQRISFHAMFLMSFLLFIPFLYSAIHYIPYTLEYMAQIREFYTQHILNSGGGSGLAYYWVVDQPVIIRLIMGSLYMSIFPIPLWGYFTPLYGEYHWIKGYHGFYMVAIVPFGIVAIYNVSKQLVRGESGLSPHIYLVLSTILGLLAVVATSLETRHYGLFLPGLLILAALPDYKSHYIRAQLRFCCIAWWGMVSGIHCYKFASLVFT